MYNKVLKQYKLQKFTCTHPRGKEERGRIKHTVKPKFTGHRNFRWRELCLALWCFKWLFLASDKSEWGWTCTGSFYESSPHLYCLLRCRSWFTALQSLPFREKACLRGWLSGWRGSLVALLSPDSSKGTSGCECLPIVGRFISTCSKYLPRRQLALKKKRSRTPSRFPMRHGPLCRSELKETPWNRHAGSNTLLSGVRFFFLRSVNPIVR